MTMESEFRPFEELSRMEKLAVKESLAEKAVALVTIFPEGIQERIVMESLRRQTHGHAAAGFALQLASEKGRLVTVHDDETGVPVLKPPVSK